MSTNHVLAPHSFEVALDALLEGFQILDADLRYVYVNEAAVRHGHTSRAALIGRRMADCYPGIEQTDMYRHLLRCLEYRVPHVLENEFHFPDGETAYFELRMEPAPQGICVLSMDITGRKKAEAKLRASEQQIQHMNRMEALGQLAAGVAHDFNNLLGIILGFGELALLRPDGPSKDDIEAMMDAAQRSAELTSQLLAYGRRQVLRSLVVEPDDLMTRLVAMLSRAMGPGIELTFRPTLPVGAIEVDAAKLEQVVTNLILNARDALPHGGKITVGLSETVLTRDDLQAHPGTSLGPHVVLSVSDTGTGMDAATQARVFEPFFTTKDPGKGTGLGLATVYGIIKQSGGDIWLQSEPGQGTTFKVYLPRVQAGATPKTTPSRPALKAVSPQPAGELVLIADDDAVLRQLAQDALTKAGYRVLAAASGPEALKLCAANPVVLLVTDLVLPGLGGNRLALLAQEQSPELRVLCTSGHASAALHEQQMLPSDAAVLEKPYLPSTLVRAVQTVLAG